jgi:pantetheine-phosphate adenylyltransferase
LAGPSIAALGGTFDHLHAAHKLLLHLSLFLATRKLIIGIMTDSLLASKSNASLVQPLMERMQRVEDFLARCGAKRRGEDDTESRVLMDVVEIHDALGPTAWDPEIDALVVSTETLSGGEMVNSTRRSKGLPELELFVIDVIASTLAQDDSRDIDRQREERLDSVKTVDLSEESDEKKLKELKMGSTAIRQWILNQSKDR